MSGTWRGVQKVGAMLPDKWFGGGTPSKPTSCQHYFDCQNIRPKNFYQIWRSSFQILSGGFKRRRDFLRHQTTGSSQHNLSELLDLSASDAFCIHDHERVRRGSA